MPRKVPSKSAKPKKKSSLLLSRSLFKNKVLLAFVGVFILVGVALVWRAFAAAPANFVYRSGTQLMLNSAPYKFVGYNAYGMTGCETGSPWSQAQIDAYFRSLPPASMTRIWAFKDRSSNLDMVVQRAEASGQKLIMTLGNGLRNCEGPSFDGGADDGNGKGTAWFQSTYKGAWMDWVRSSVTKYRNSPAVGMWEVSNEGGHLSSITSSMMKSYYDTTAATIKGLDAQHLVSTGALAPYTYGGESGYQEVHSGANIDVVSFHEYDGGTISNHFAGAQRAANNLNKPIFVGEVGTPYNSMLSGQTRADWMKRRFDAYLAAGAAGVLPWNYGQGNYGGWTIFPGDATATMVSNYRISGVVPGATPAPTTQPPASTPTPAWTPAPTTNPVPTRTPAPTPTPTPWWTPAPTPAPWTPAPTPAPISQRGLTGTYFNSVYLSGTSKTRIDPTVNFNWGYNAPMSGIPADYYSARWTGKIKAPSTGWYGFYLRGDDGMRLWVNNQRIINAWYPQSASNTHTGWVYLIAGQSYPIKLEYYENRSVASVRMSWEGPDFATRLVENAALSPR